MAEGVRTSIGEDIRWVFASFLFAFLISDVALKFSTLVGKWKTGGAGKWPTLSHLILAAVVVVTSWIGWSVSIMNGRYPQLTEVFGRPTLELLLDLALLTLYFILISGIKVEHSDVGHLSNDARHVSFWSMVILLGYLLWDFVTTVLIPYPDTHFGLLGSVSVVCAALAVLAFLLFKGISADRPGGVFLADVALVFLFLLFRAMKQYASSVTGSESARPLLPPAPPSSVTIGVIAWIFFGVFVLATALAFWSTQLGRRFPKFFPKVG